jgi:hypothetical protein
MTEQELKDRLSKKEVQISKIEKRIAKWNAAKTTEAFIKHEAEFYSETPKSIKTLQDLINARNAYWGGRESYEESKKFIESSMTDYYRNCDREIGYAENDLQTAKDQLAKINASIQQKAEFASEEKVKVIWDFLLNWRAQARQYFIENAEYYADLKKNEEKAFGDWCAENNLEVVLGDYWSERPHKAKFKEWYYRNVATLTKDLCGWGTKIDEKALDKKLDRDIQIKYIKFIAQITDKAGDIVDATHLEIGGKGDINGYVIGTKNNVHVETITAGGYNVGQIVNVKHGQILHYRTLVNIIGKRA